MVAVVDCKCVSLPTGVISGSATPRYQARWHVEVDDAIPGTLVMDLASSFAADPAKLQRSLPAFGEPFEFRSPGGVIYRDDSAYALDFTPKMYFPNDSDDPHNWSIEVTWRPPTPGRDEQPSTLRLPPLQRDPEYWIEYNNDVIDVTSALNVDTNQFEVMRNSAGQVLPPLQLSTLLPVVVMAVNVQSPIDSLNINDTYDTTVNGAAFNLLGKRIAPRTARFIRAETGQAQYYEGQRYYRMQVRVEINRVEYIDFRRNVGDWVLDSDGNRKAVLDADGFSLPGPFNLLANGTLAPDGVDTYKPYLKYGEANYATLLRQI